MKLLLLSVCILLLINNIYANVIELNSANFEEKLSSDNKAFFIKFYAPWCGHCKKLAPTWDELGKELSKDINIAKVDCTANKDICQKHSIRGYPSLLLFNGGDPTKYMGGRNIEAFKIFLAKNEALAPPTIQLRYFGTRGRAEFIRLILAETGLDFEEVVHGKDWVNEKAEGMKSGQIPFGQLPVLTWNDMVIPQSTAIARFLGRKKGLYPSDIKKAVDVDVVLGLYDDIRSRVGRLVYDAEFEKKRNKVVEEDLPPWIQHAANYLSTKTYFSGDKLTIGDIAMFDVINTVLALNSNILNNHKNLSDWHKRIAERDAIKNYINSERRPKHQNGKSAYFDNEANPSNYKLHVEL